MFYFNKFRGFFLGLLFALSVTCPAKAESLKVPVLHVEKERIGFGSERNAKGSKDLRNSMSMALVATSGGFGGRGNYYRKLNSIFGVRLGFEFVSYTKSHVLQKLDITNNPYIEPINIISLPFGFRGSFKFLSHFVPHLEAGIGPYMRFDHQEQIREFYPGFHDLTRSDTVVISRKGTPDFRHIVYPPDYNRSDVYNILSDINLLFDLASYISKTSFSFGAFAGGGFDILLGEDLDAAITVNGYYRYIQFPENLFQPGDFSGFFLSVGFMKYF